MPMAIGVRIRNAGKLHYVHPGTLWPSAGNAVIVETARGIEYADVILGIHEVPDSSIPPYRLIRIATADDEARHVKNTQMEEEAHVICQDKILAHKLEMKLIGVEYTFNQNKLTAYFTANGRVDFRALVKDLASTFRTRIELKQIGVRDEAKMLGGLGPCGRPICCAQFLGDFQPVSIRMAKDQNLSLNPTKISGVCGRLMCCLKYEEEQYEKARKKMPRVGKEVSTPDGRGVVTDVNLLLETLSVRIAKGDGSELKVYEAREVQRLSPASEDVSPRKAGVPRTACNRKTACDTIAALEAVASSDEEFIETSVEIVHTGEGVPDD